MKTLLSFAILFVVGFQAQAVGPSVTSGIGNPSAVFCVNAGGSLVSTITPHGESAVCYLGQAGIEPWTLFHAAKYKSEKEAVTAFLKSGKANQPSKAQATANCRAQGGSVVTYKIKSQESTVSLCQFSDGSQIEVSTLFLGAAAPQNKTLVNVLGQN